MSVCAMKQQLHCSNQDIKETKLDEVGVRSLEQKRLCCYSVSLDTVHTDPVTEDRCSANSQKQILISHRQACRRQRMRSETRESWRQALLTPHGGEALAATSVSSLCPSLYSQLRALPVGLFFPVIIPIPIGNSRNWTCQS